MCVVVQQQQHQQPLLWNRRQGQEKLSVTFQQSHFETIFPLNLSHFLLYHLFPPSLESQTINYGVHINLSRLIVLFFLRQFCFWTLSLYKASVITSVKPSVTEFMLIWQLSKSVSSLIELWHTFQASLILMKWNNCFPLVSPDELEGCRCHRTPHLSHFNYNCKLF